MNLQPILENDLLIAKPLREEDFESLYSAASDPLIWAQHPNRNRYKREVFKTFFEGAMNSGGAFIVYDKKSGEVIGSSRFYDFNAEKKEIFIGYTFFVRKCWGKGINHALKRLMLNHAFQFAEKVIFHIGAENIPSQKSIAKLGAVKIGEQEVQYFGETLKLNFVYEIRKQDYFHGINPSASTGS